MATGGPEPVICNTFPPATPTDSPSRRRHILNLPARRRPAGRQHLPTTRASTRRRAVLPVPSDLAIRDRASVVSSRAR